MRNVWRTRADTGLPDGVMGAAGFLGVESKGVGHEAQLQQFGVMVMVVGGGLMVLMVIVRGRVGMV